MDFSTQDRNPTAQAMADADSFDVTQTVTQADGSTRREPRKGLLSLVKAYVFGKTQTATAQVSLPAGTTAKAPLNIAGGVAPTSPVDGDIWSDGTNLKIRISGTTYTITKS